LKDLTSEAKLRRFGLWKGVFRLSITGK